VRGGETPRVNGYAFVDDGEPEEETKSEPIIHLGRGDATPNPFQLQSRGKRERLHHRMVERMAESKRTSARLGQTPTPSYPISPRVRGSLTPAARRLWSQIGSAGKSASTTPFDGKATPRERIKNIAG